MALEYNDVKRLSKKIEGLQTMIDEVKINAVNQIAERLNNRVKKATPSRTSTLRKGWHLKAAKLEGGPGSRAIAKMYNDALSIADNPVEYAPYVEYGHRIVRNEKTVGWVPGKHMLATSEAKTSKEMVKIIDIELGKMGFK